MEAATAMELSARLAEVWLAGLTEQEIVSGFCERAHAAGLAIARVSVFVDTLHPSYQGQMFRWRCGQKQNADQIRVVRGRRCTHELMA